MTNMSREKIYETLLVIAAGFIAVYFILRQEERRGENAQYFLVAAFGVIVASLIYKPIGKWIHWGWFKLAEGLGYVMSRVLLTAVFYLFLFPIALLSRMGGKDGLKLKKRQDSYYDERNVQYDAKSMENIF